jgi:hypothetical protein
MTPKKPDARGFVSKAMTEKPIYDEKYRAMFFSDRNVDKSGSCWIWLRAKDGKGYGLANYKSKSLRAHRASYEMCIGEIGKDMTIDHHCERKDCVNPDHLNQISRANNTSLSQMTQNTHCPSGHPFDEENTTWYKHYRRCKACHRINAKKYRKMDPERYRAYRRANYLRNGR